MILDKISQLRQYETLYPDIASIQVFLEEEHAPGTYELDGKRLYAIVQKYRTRPASEIPWELHQKYVDLQCVLQGEENIGWCAAEELTACSVYDQEHDCMVSGELRPAASLRVGAGEFAVFAPWDAHKPGCTHIAAGEVKKIVFKIAL